MTFRPLLRRRAPIWPATRSVDPTPLDRRLTLADTSAPSDARPLEIDLSFMNGMVAVDFRRAIQWAMFTADEAEDLAVKLAQHARAARLTARDSVAAAEGGMVIDDSKITVIKAPVDGR